MTEKSGSSRRISRRGFLKEVAKTGAKIGAAVVLANLPGFANPSPVSAESTPPVRPPEVLENGFKIIFGADGLPEKYIYPGGKEVSLDKAHVKQLQEQAKNQKEMEFLDIVGMEKPTPQHIASPSKEHPVFKEKPDDEVSTERLKAKGIEIIQGEKVELGIRESAFLEDGPLASFKEEGPTKLIIVLVDGPAIAGAYLSDPKYDKVRGAIKDPASSEDFTQKFIEDANRFLDRTRKSVAEAQMANEPTEIIKGDIPILKERLFRAKNMPEDLLKIWAEETTTTHDRFNEKFAGEYIEPNKEGLQIPPDTAIIFVAAGSSKLPEEEIYTYFDENGNFKAELKKFRRPPSKEPTAKDSIPNPKDFIKNPLATESEERSYPYGGQSIGLIIYHELMHHKMIWLNKLKGLPADKNEYRTDTLAIDQVQRNWEPWEKSGYVDHSKQCLTVRLPSGEYIYTKINMQNLPQAA